MIFKLQNFQVVSMKRKIIGLDPIPAISKSEASYEKLMLEMMSKLVNQTKENNSLIRDHFGTSPKANMNQTFKTLKEKSNLPLGVTQQDWQEANWSPGKDRQDTKVSEVYESQSGKNLKQKTLKPSLSAVRLGTQFQASTLQPQKESKIEKVLMSLEHRLRSGQQVNKKLLEKIQKLQLQKQQAEQAISKHHISMKDMQQASNKENELNLIEKAIADKFSKSLQGETEGKKNSYILSEILPYSDRREIKVKFRISDILVLAEQERMDDLKAETTEWIGQVYRATASICWNMLLNNYLSFEEVKILFTENIIFNFVQFMKELNKIGKENIVAELTSIINKKSVSILDFLCRQYPQTKIQAPNLALRSILPQIDNQGRSKYDLVCRSGISFTYREEGDYTDQIMRMINFMIETSNEEFDEFFSFMRETFEEIYKPIHKRRKLQPTDKNQKEQISEPTHEDMAYKQKAKSYTKYLIGRKIPKNTSLYTQQEIADGIFFVKSNAVLRIITKWVEELKEYFQSPEKKIKNNYNENKDHNGKIMYLSALLKNGIHDQILKNKDALFEKINKIRKECEKMEHLLTDQEYTSDPSQVHLSEEQISVGMYSCNIKSVISSYICGQLNKLIHFLLKTPRQLPEDSLGSDLEVFQSQARKQLDAVNLVTFKLFDLLRCKIHSNEEEIIWIVKYLIFQSENNRKQFKIVRIKDRLGLGTRDIMINAQINKGLVCEIQLSVTSNSDKKQELLDSYNHFLYELKRSELGSIIQNVSIWSNLEQRFSYFEQLLAKKKQKEAIKLKDKTVNHKCGLSNFKTFKRPLICKQCSKFYPIPTTCLLNVICLACGTTVCGECYYYNYLDAEERKAFIFNGNHLLKPDVMNRLYEYTDFSQPLPTPGFFIKKDFLTKQMSFYMAIQKDKQENVKDAPCIEILIIQTIIRNGAIFNRQVNKKKIEARLQKGQFFIKDYEKSQLSSFIIFYFQKKESKKMMTLKDLQTELQKPENSKTKVLNILREPSYIHNLHLLKKESEKLKEMSSLSSVIKDGKIIVYCFNHFLLLAQVFVKGSLLRSDIRKKLNLNELKSFAQKDTDIVSMQYKHMTTQMQDISWKFKPKMYTSFCSNLKKLFLSNGQIESIKCFKNFKNLETVFINENKLTSLEGVEELQSLVSFRFDNNQIQSLQPLSNLLSMRYLSGNSNKIKNLKGLENINQLRSLSLYENQLQSIEQLNNNFLLEELFIRDNPITDLSVIKNLTKLTKLFIGKTKPKVLPDLSQLKQLKCLSLESLNLDKIPTIFSTLLLNELSLSNNNITELVNLDNQAQLVTLNLSNNKITEIKNIDNLDKLESLKLNNNKISKIKGVKHLDSIKYLNLKNNPIEDLGELLSYQIGFKYVLTQETLSEIAKKQLSELEVAKSTNSSSDD